MYSVILTNAYTHVIHTPIQIENISIPRNFPMFSPGQSPHPPRVWTLKIFSACGQGPYFLKTGFSETTSLHSGCKIRNGHLFVSKGSNMAASQRGVLKSFHQPCPALISPRLFPKLPCSTSENRNVFRKSLCPSDPQKKKTNIACRTFQFHSLPGQLLNLRAPPKQRHLFVR